MHTLIVGAPGVGKSTLIRRLLAECTYPVFGYLTRKEDALMDLEKEPRGAPIYIYPAGGPEDRTEENLVGFCVDRRPIVLPEGFARFAPRLLAACPEDAVIVMDEIGFMETQAPAFCEAIRARLDGDIPVLAAVKDKQTEFLETVRNHPDCRCFYLNKENREEQFELARVFFQTQLSTAVRRRKRSGAM